MAAISSAVIFCCPRTMTLVFCLDHPHFSEIVDCFILFAIRYSWIAPAIFICVTPQKVAIFLTYPHTITIFRYCQP